MGGAGRSFAARPARPTRPHCQAPPSRQPWSAPPLGTLPWRPQDLQQSYTRLQRELQEAAASARRVARPPAFSPVPPPVPLAPGGGDAQDQLLRTLLAFARAQQAQQAQQGGALLAALPGMPLPPALQPPSGVPSSDLSTLAAMLSAAAAGRSAGPFTPLDEAPLPRSYP